MAESKRLAAHRAAAPGDDPNTDEIEIPNPVDEPGEGELTAKPKKEPKMPNEDDATAAIDTARTEGHGAGFKAANERMNQVLASEHYAGRETLAQSLLASDKLTAAEVIDHLAKAPKAAAPVGAELTDEQKREAAEAGGRAEMKDALAASGNSNIDAGGGAKPDAKAEADAVWNKAYGLDKGVK